MNHSAIKRRWPLLAEYFLRGREPQLFALLQKKCAKDGHQLKVEHRGYPFVIVLYRNGSRTILGRGRSLRAALIRLLIRAGEGSAAK